MNARRIQPAKKRSIVPKRTAQIISAITAKNWMKAMMMMKHVMVFCVLMNFVRPGFFLHLPKTAMRHPKKAAIKNGKGRMPISLIVTGMHAVSSEFIL